MSVTPAQEDFALHGRLMKAESDSAGKRQKEVAKGIILGCYRRVVGSSSTWGWATSVMNKQIGGWSRSCMREGNEGLTSPPDFI